MPIPSSQASNVDPKGDFIPAPSGNLSYLRVPDILYPAGHEETFGFFGFGRLSTSESGAKCSFETAIVNNNTSEQTGLGYRIFQFGFPGEHGVLYNATNTYGGEDQALQAVMQSVASFSWNKPSTEFFQIAAHPLVPTTEKDPLWKMESAGAPIPYPPLYKGKVGQPGHQYAITGKGDLFLWRYEVDGGKTLWPYSYTFGVNFLDERGVVLEGFGGGYVGPVLTAKKEESKDSGSETQLEEVEYDLPRLKVTNWSVNLTAKNRDSLPRQFQTEYQLLGNEGLLLIDCGMIKAAPPSSNCSRRGRFSSVMSTLLENNFFDRSQRPLEDRGHALSPSLGDVSLYNGNWIVLQFEKGKYAGSSFHCSTVWNKVIPNPIGQDTDDPTWASWGWANFFTGLLPQDVASTYSVSEILALNRATA